MFHKRLLSEFKENRKYVMGIVMCQWIGLIANVALMLTTSGILYNLLERNITSREITIYALVFMAAVIVRSTANYFSGKLSFKASSVVKVRLREMVYRKLSEIGSSYKAKIATSEAVQVSTEGVEQLEIYFGKYMPQFFYSLLAPVTLFFIVGTMSIKVAVVLLICVPLIPISIIAVQKFAKKMLNKYWGVYTGLGDSFLENLQGLTTLKIYNADERYAKKMDEEAEKFRKVTMRVLIMQLNSISVMDLIAYGGSAIGIILSIIELQRGNINFAQCFFIIMISAEFFLPLRLLGSFFHIAMNGNAAADKIFKLLDVKADEKGEIRSVEDDTISFENVVFGYEENKEVLKGISFEIEKNKFTALVGASGCGKSTIASIIMGEHKKYSGSVKMGDTQVKELDESYLFSKITRIKHDSYIFKGTVRDNLLMGNENATESMMKDALKKVNLIDFVEEMGGLDMKLNEKGSNISGGQKQRLALARALLHDSDIYIFDEATSNIDAESEDMIMNVIHELRKEKTVILISHRLANVEKADRIIMVESGKIKEIGSHLELMENRNAYEKLFMSQRRLENFTEVEVNA